MTLEAAMVAGLYPVTPSGDAPVSQQQPQQQQVDGADTFSVPANITENISHLTGVVGDQMVQSLFTTVSSGREIPESVYRDIASRMGIEPAHAKAVIQSSMAPYFEAGRKALGTEGVPESLGDHFTEWALRSQQGQYMRQQYGVWHAADGVVLERRGMALFVHLEYTADAEAPRRRATVNLDTNEVSITSRVDAVVVMQDALLNDNVRVIADLAARKRFPSSGSKDFAEAGGVIGYGWNISDNNRRAALFVDKILRGTKPADLPVEQPTKFELVINLKTAKALGLTIPQTLLLRADQVIE